MKRRSFSLWVLLISSVAVILSVGKVSRPAVLSFALDSNSTPASEAASQGSETILEVEESEYSLPYPGILPDHPMYFLKMARDRLVLIVTRDPLKRTRLMLHYADKRIAAALALAEKWKIGLALSTASKAEGYLERGLQELERIGKRPEAAGWIDQLLSALSGHERVLLGILSRTPDEMRSAVDDLLRRNALIRESVAVFFSEPLPPGLEATEASPSL